MTLKDSREQRLVERTRGNEQGQSLLFDAPHDYIADWIAKPDGTCEELAVIIETKYGSPMLAHRLREHLISPGWAIQMVGMPTDLEGFGYRYDPKRWKRKADRDE